MKRVIDTSFWTDDKVVDLFSPEDRYFFLYLMTNPHTTQLGIYAINKKYMAFETGYSLDTIKVLLDRFEREYDIIRYSEPTGEVAIKNYLRHSIVKGGKPIEDQITAEIKKVQDKSLLKYVHDALVTHDNLNASVVNVLPLLDVNVDVNVNVNVVSYHDSHNDSYHDSSIVQDVISYLNEKVGTNYRPSTRKTRDLIKARQKENFSLDDFKTVINKKTAEWKGTDMEKYLRPETLFGTKFESYLNQREVKPKEDMINHNYSEDYFEQRRRKAIEDMWND